MPGQAGYRKCYEKDLSHLYIKGMSQALVAALDQRLKSANIIVSSPNTKALQIASIIRQKTNIELTVDMDLEEYSTFEEFLELTKDFSTYSNEEKRRLEELYSLRNRVKNIYLQ
jgi:Fructose-2,6-bisphosphatase